jgi:hypothetical protein
VPADCRLRCLAGWLLVPAGRPPSLPALAPCLLVDPNPMMTPSSSAAAAARRATTAANYACRHTPQRWLARAATPPRPSKGCDPSPRQQLEALPTAHLRELLLLRESPSSPPHDGGAGVAAAAVATETTRPHAVDVVMGTTPTAALLARGRDALVDALVSDWCPRAECALAGVPVPTPLLRPLMAELHSLEWPQRNERGRCVAPPPHSHSHSHRQQAAHWW